MTSTIVTLPLGKELDASLPSILALDPGGTTGWANYESSVRSSVTCGQLGPRGHHSELERLIESVALGGHIVVVFESFAFRLSEEPVRNALRSFTAELRKGTVTSKSTVIAALEEMTLLGQERHGLDLSSVEYIGVIKLVAQHHDTIELRPQTPSAGKSFVDDKKLKALGWLERTRGMPDTRDALRHLIKYLVGTCGVRDPITTLWTNGNPSVSSLTR